MVFTDVRLPGMSGIDLLRRIREFDAAIPVVIMTAHGTIEGAVEAVKLGAFDYLKKPVDLEELKLLADRAREQSRREGELSYYRRQAAREEGFGGVVGESPAMRAVLERARQIAALEETPPVLITGETGTGKGLVARTIHASGHTARPSRSSTSTAPRCPGSLMEAELFGYERGAFTDAKESKLGLFEAAEGGFIFLDEVGDIELALQGKLLRAIEERTVRRVGGIRDRTIDVRILAATNRDLERESQRERFRKDLYFRLAVILLRLPPLRERGDDVLRLADHYLRQFSAKYGRDVRRIDALARERLLRYPWPGQRPGAEPRHRAGGALEPGAGARGGAPVAHRRRPRMPSAPRPPSNGEPEQAGAGSADRRRFPPPGVDLAQWEKTMIEQALREAGGNQTRAAQRLGISRDTLRYRLKKFGIQG